MAQLTNADLGFSGNDNPFAEPQPESTTSKQETKTVKPTSKMQVAASTGAAPAVQPPAPNLSAPAAPVLPPLTNASAPPLPTVDNPATTGDFWKSAAASSIPSLLSGLGLAVGGYSVGKMNGGKGSVAPPVDEEMRQIKLEQEKAKHQAIVEENYRKQQAHDAKMLAQAKHAETQVQQSQGKASSQTSTAEQVLQAKALSEKNARDKAINAELKASQGGLTKEEASMKNYLVKSQYGGGEHGEKAYEKTIEILGKRPSYEPGQGGGLSKEETNTIKAWRKENIEGPKVNLNKDMKKAFRGGAGIAALVAIPGFAEAAQRKDYRAMNDIASNLAESLLPIGMTPTTAGAPVVPPSRFTEAAKLGSPYYETDWAKKERSKAVPPPR